MRSEWEGTLESIRQRQRLSSVWIVAVAAGTLMFLAASLAGLWLFYHAQGAIGPRLPVVVFPAPALQSDPAGDLRALEKTQREQLNGYAWIDRPRGVIQVPIERAMEIVAARGDKAYEPPVGPRQ